MHKLWIKRLPNWPEIRSVIYYKKIEDVPTCSGPTASALASKNTSPRSPGAAPWECQRELRSQRCWTASSPCLWNHHSVSKRYHLNNTWLHKLLLSGLEVHFNAIIFHLQHVHCPLVHSCKGVSTEAHTTTNYSLPHQIHFLSQSSSTFFISGIECSQRGKLQSRHLYYHVTFSLSWSHLYDFLTPSRCSHPYNSIWHKCSFGIKRISTV